jgi:predicted ATPase
MRPVNRIEITGFKSIREAKLDLSKLNVFIGPNGAGKSNFIGVFKLLNRIIDQKLSVYVAEQGGANSLLHFGRKRTQKISLKLDFADGKNRYGCVLSPSAEDALFFEEEWCGYSGSFQSTGYASDDYRVPMGRGHKETQLLTEAQSYRNEKKRDGIAAYVRDDFRSWRLYHFHDTSPSAGVKQTGDLTDNRFLRDDASNLAAFLYQLQETQRSHYDNIVGAVRMVAPFFEDFVLAPSELNADKIRLEWKEVGSDEYFNASALSDGTLRFICLATLLLQPKLPSAVLIDEPELGLHPAAITLLAELLRSTSNRSQVIVSTQSVTLVNQLAPEEVVVVEHLDGSSAFRRLSDEQLKDWLGDYGLGELWEKNLVGGRP